MATNVSWPLIAGLALVITGVVIYVVAMRLPRVSGTPLLVFATIFGALGAAILLFCLVTYFGIHALGAQ
jgi:hypothetical protein